MRNLAQQKWQEKLQRNIAKHGTINSDPVACAHEQHHEQWCDHDPDQ